MGEKRIKEEFVFLFYISEQYDAKYKNKQINKMVESTKTDAKCLEAHTPND